MSKLVQSDEAEKAYRELLRDEQIIEMGRELDALLAEADDLAVELQWYPNDKHLHERMAQKLEVIGEFRKLLDTLIRSAK